MGRRGQYDAHTGLADTDFACLGTSVKKHGVWSINLDMYIKICELATLHGKKPGDSMHDEFEEIKKQYPEQFVSLGSTDKDIDVLTGDLREEGLRVLNIKEEERKRNRTEGGDDGNVC